MRLALALTCLAAPASGWEFSPDPVCTLARSAPEGAVVVTYDPAIPEYAIALTLPDGMTWPEAPGFAIAFHGGPRPFAIQTDRHSLSEGGRTLTVRDVGFGNVLLGLDTATTARAVSGESALDVPLAGIAAPLAAFEACPEPALS